VPPRAGWTGHRFVADPCVRCLVGRSLRQTERVLRAANRVGVVVLLMVGAGCAKPATTYVPIPPPSRPVADLRADSSSPVAQVRRESAWALAGVPKPKKDLIASLEHLLEDPAQEVRYAGAWALGHLSPHQYFDTAPVPEAVRPEYPPAAFRKRITGTVLVEVLVGEAGKIAHAEVRESIPELDAAALACVHRWKFRPAERKGRPVAVLVQAPISFAMVNR
jgi:TonB family protein